MRRLRPLVRALAWLLPLGTAACLDDAPVAPGAEGRALRIEARLDIAARTHQEIGIRAFYTRSGGETPTAELPVSPNRIRVADGEAVTSRVTTRLDACFADPAVPREGPGCPLTVELSLLGTDGTVQARQAQSVFVTPGQSEVVVPGFTLSLSSIAGVVRNALTGAGLGGTTVRLFAGNSATGTPLATATAASTGAYSFTGVSPGTYTLEVSGAGLITSTSPITVDAGANAVADLVVSPTLTAGTIRIVLTWGDAPSDLDSHLWGPPSASNYHLFYGADQFPPYANLDVDDTNGRGPETVTITQVAPGRHVYAVHDFSNRSSTTSSALGASGARVQVFGSTGVLANFTVPNQPGTLWTVFTLDGTTITPVNRMTFASPGATPPSTTAVASRVSPSSAPLPEKGTAGRLP